MTSASTKLMLGRVQDLSHILTTQGVDWLSPSEQARLAAMKLPVRRAQFLSGRWMARQLLAASFGGDVRGWAISAPASGPPQVEYSPSAKVGEVHLSLSHSADYVACAVSRARVGIDLEAPRRPRNLVGVAELICTAEELARLQMLSGARYDAGFFDLWTLKEAWIKFHAEDLSPARLARIQTRPAATGRRGSAKLWRGADLVLALVNGGGDVRMHGPDLESAVFEEWIVEDVEARRAGALGVMKPV